MKTKKTVMTLAVCLVAVGVSFASPNMGTWKLNEAKSTFPRGHRNLSLASSGSERRPQLHFAPCDPRYRPL